MLASCAPTFYPLPAMPDCVSNNAGKRKCVCVGGGGTLDPDSRVQAGMLTQHHAQIYMPHANRAVALHASVWDPEPSPQQQQPPLLAASIAHAGCQLAGAFPSSPQARGELAAALQLTQIVSAANEGAWPEGRGEWVGGWVQLGL